VANAPDSITLRVHKTVTLVEGDHLGAGTDELSDRHSAAIGQQHQGLAGHAIT
jgi:hypothetical protein